MRAPFPKQTRLLAIALALPLLAAAQPAAAQVTSGNSSSNAANRSYEMQNSMRAIQQQQTFDTNQLRAQQRTDQLFNRPQTYPGAYAPRRGR